MKTKLSLNPHTEVEVTVFAEEMGVSIERAQYTEYMRATYLSHEYDYVYSPKKRKTISKLSV